MVFDLLTTLPCGSQCGPLSVDRIFSIGKKMEKEKSIIVGYIDLLNAILIIWKLVGGWRWLKFNSYRLETA